jgi:hypothetical protein
MDVNEVMDWIDDSKQGRTFAKMLSNFRSYRPTYAQDPIISRNIDLIIAELETRQDPVGGKKRTLKKRKQKKRTVKRKH